MEIEKYCKKLNIVVGHYGTGKTNFCVNLALYLSDMGEKVTIIDLDVVNPYFKTADFKGIFEEKGIKLIAPNFANTNLDVPSLSANIDMAIASNDGCVIVDVGGDDAGAIALGRYKNKISSTDYAAFYVVNKYRYLTSTKAQMIEMLNDIEAVSGIKITVIVNNSNLGSQTTKETVLDSLDLVCEMAAEMKLPVACNCIVREIGELTDNDFLVENMIKTYD